MAGPISRVPRGLSSLLQLKGGLSNPNELADFVIPTMEMLDFYQTDKRERSVSSIIDAPDPVPDNELHIIWHMHWEALLPAAITLIQISPVIRVSGTLSKSILPNLSSLFQGNDFLVASYGQMPLFALPGTIFAFVVNRRMVAASNTSFSLEREFTRLQL